MSTTYSDELALALSAIHRASLVTKSVLRSLNNSVSAESKPDNSPVTVADFAAQCLIISAIHAVYPHDLFLGEESAAALRENVTLRDEVWKVVSTHTPTSGAFAGLAIPENVEEMLEIIDLGQGSQSASGRVWVMDPVDGTAAFMKGEQYAVCLCLLVGGVQKVGVIGCPNLPFDVTRNGDKIHEAHVDKEGCGVVVSAVVGQGASVREMAEERMGVPEPLKWREGDLELGHLDFVDSSPSMSRLSTKSHEAVAKRLGAPWPGTRLWSQQMKYVSLALGSTDVMLRIPRGRDRYTQIWDHAGGQLIFTETGGVIRDLDGGEIDFGQGRKLQGEKNFGMVAARPQCFAHILKAAQEVVAQGEHG